MGKDNAEKGEVITIEVRADDFKDILGFQLGLQYDIALLELVDIQTEGLPGFDQNNIGHTPKNGLINLVWTAPDLEAVSTLPEEAILTMTFNVLGRIDRLDRALNQTTQQLSGLAYNKKERQLDISLQYQGSDGFVVQHFPNPFSKETALYFYMPQSDWVSLEIRDIRGQLIYQSREKYAKGKQVITLNKELFSGSGVFVYSLQTSHEVATGQLIYIQ